MSKQVECMPVLGIQRTRLAKILHGSLEAFAAQLDEPYPTV